LRRQLFLLLVINFSFGWSLLFAPQRIAIVQSGLPTLQGVGPDLYGLGFLLAALLCLAGMALWSRWAERHVLLSLIQGTRRLAQAMSLWIIIVWSALSVLGVLFYGLNWLSLITYIIVIVLENNQVGHANLTPSQEQNVWHLLKSKED
jgi:hypothetical protein